MGGDITGLVRAGGIAIGSDLLTKLEPELLVWISGSDSLRLNFAASSSFNKLPELRL